ncbi:MAG: hypothetical protein EOP49_43090 [Sphingobacteriales bacterium]|nr:MAG: hypothetical protein EOP49_43090 [Sphingobacteriales bacterium]
MAARQKVTPLTEINDPVKPLTGEQRAGYNLAIFILCILSGVLLALILLFCFVDFDNSERMYQALDKHLSSPDSTYNRRVEQVKMVIEEKKEYRDFVAKNFHYVISIIVPILTSILGYIFGSKKA